jgi:hypothetical protein
MTALPAVALSPFFLKDKNFLSPQLVDDLAGYARIGHQRGTDLYLIAATDE